MKKIVISGVIGWDVEPKDIKDQFKDVKPTDEIEIEVNSPGGLVFDGIEISNMIKAHPGKTTTIATSLTASMGSYIMMAGDYKKAYDDATFMIHNASTIAWGDHRALRKAANVNESLTKLLSKSYERQTGQSNAEIREMMDAETWLFGNEILEAGFIDEIIQTEKPEPKDEAVAFQKLVFQDSIKKISDPETANQDVDKLAAYFKASTAGTPAKTPTKKGNMNKDEFLAFLNKTPEAKAAYDKIMAEAKPEPQNLDEALAASAEMKAEFDTAIETAKSEASTALESGKISKSDARYVATVLASGKYGKPVQDLGVDFFTGETEMKIFKMVVALEDQQNEKLKSLGIQQNQPDATPGDPAYESEAAEQAQMKTDAAEVAKNMGLA